MRSRPLRLCLAATLSGMAVLTGCEPPPAPVSAPMTAMDETAATLLGFRALRRTASGLLPIFDAEKMPVIRIVPDAPAGVRLAWVASAVTTPIPVTHDGKAGFVLVRAQGSALPVGTGTFQLEDAKGGVLRAWPARVDVPPAQLASVRAVAESRRTKGDAAALALAETLRLTTDVATLPWLMVERARCIQNGDNPEAAAAAWRLAAEAATAAELPTEVTRDWRAAAFQLFNHRHFQQALAFLDDAAKLDREVSNDEGLARGGMYRAQIAAELGDFRTAAGLYVAAGKALRESGLDADVGGADRGLAHVLQAQGEHRQALELLRRSEPSQWSKETDRASFEINLGWAELEAMVQGAIPRDLSSPRALFRNAAGRSQREDNRSLEAVAHVNLAWAAFLDGDLADPDDAQCGR